MIEIRKRNPAEPLFTEEERSAVQPRPIILFVTGDPGSGKSTEAKRAAIVGGLAYLSIGDAIRELGEAASIADGRWADDDLVDSIVLDFIAKNGDCIIDGYPRKEKQAFVLPVIQRELNTQVSVSWMSISIEDALQRYRDNGVRRNPKDHSYGITSDHTVDDVPSHYRNRRERQAPDLERAKRALGYLGIRLKEWKAPL